jgi:hypothetical protein
MLDQNVISILFYAVVPFCLILRIAAVWIAWRGGNTNGNGSVDTLD